MPPQRSSRRSKKTSQALDPGPSSPLAAKFTPINAKKQKRTRSEEEPLRAITEALTSAIEKGKETCFKEHEVVTEGGVSYRVPRQFQGESFERGAPDYYEQFHAAHATVSNAAEGGPSTQNYYRNYYNNKRNGNVTFDPTDDDLPQWNDEVDSAGRPTRAAREHNSEIVSTFNQKSREAGYPIVLEEDSRLKRVESARERQITATDKFTTLPEAYRETAAVGVLRNVLHKALHENDAPNYLFRRGEPDSLPDYVDRSLPVTMQKDQTYGEQNQFPVLDQLENVRNDRRAAAAQKQNTSSRSKAARKRTAPTSGAFSAEPTAVTSGPIRPPSRERGLSPHIAALQTHPGVDEEFYDELGSLKLPPILTAEDRKGKKRVAGTDPEYDTTFPKRIKLPSLAEVLRGIMSYSPANPYPVAESAPAVESASAAPVAAAAAAPSRPKRKYTKRKAPQEQHVDADETASDRESRPPAAKKAKKTPANEAVSENAYELMQPGAPPGNMIQFTTVQSIAAPAAGSPAVLQPGQTVTTTTTTTATATPQPAGSAGRRRRRNTAAPRIVRYDYKAWSRNVCREQAGIRGTKQNNQNKDQCLQNVRVYDAADPQRAAIRDAWQQEHGYTES